MSPNDPFFSSEIQTWCPRCSARHSNTAGDLAEDPRIECARCHYGYAIDRGQLDAEIVARKVTAASRRRIATKQDERDRDWEHYLYASRGQRPLYPVAPR